MDRRPPAPRLAAGELRARPAPARVGRADRYRTTLIRERAAERNRLQKTLEGAGIKLGSVASDVLGSSGRLMLEALPPPLLDSESGRDRPSPHAGRARGVAPRHRYSWSWTPRLC